MADPIGALRVDLEANVAKFNRDMGKAKASVAKNTRAMNKSFKGTSQQISKMAGGLKKFQALLVGVLAGATVSFIRRQIEMTASIGDTADKIGLTTKELQAYRFAAASAGVAQKTFDNAMRVFTRKVGEAATGTGTLKDILEKYGIALKDSVTGKTRRAVDILDDFADALKTIQSPAEKLAVAVKAFESEGLSMINMLGDGSQAVKALVGEFNSLGYAITEETIRRAQAAGKEFAVLDAVFRKAGAALAIEFLPLLKDLAAIMQDPAFVKGVKGVADEFRTLFEFIADHKKELAILAGAMAGAKAGAIFGPKGKLIGGALGAAGAGWYMSEGPTPEEEVDILVEKMGVLSPTSEGWIKMKKRLDEVRKGIIKAELDKIEEQFEGGGLNPGALAAIAAAEAAAIAEAKTAAAAKAAAEKAAIEKAKELDARMLVAAPIGEFLDAGRMDEIESATAVAENMAAETAAIAEATAEAAAETERFNAAMKNVAIATENVFDGVDDIITGIKDGTMEWYDVLRKALPLVEKFLSAVASTGSGGSGGWGAIGGVLGGMFGFAEGGQVGRTGPALVHKGERVLTQPQNAALMSALTPSKSMLGASAAMASGGGSSEMVVVNNNFSVGVSETVRQQLMGMMPFIEQRTEASVMAAINSGGSMSRAVGRRS